MPSRPEDLYLADIIEAGHDVRRFVGGRSADEWHADKVSRYAVLARLTILGEAANRLSPSLRTRYAGVPWREIIGFRNVAVHEYFAVEWHVVWRIAEYRLPELIDYVVKIMQAEYPETAARLAERLERGE
jgi:uncharacterized protein with HEPN domain